MSNQQLVTDSRILNNIKEKMSIAYLYGLNAVPNYALQKSDKDLDDIGVDFSVTNKVLGPGRTIGSEAHTINIQLKAVSEDSASMIKQTNKDVQYRLRKDFIPIGTHYLVIVVLPKESEMLSWCTVTAEELILKERAYYVLMPETRKAGFITIPKSNILNAETYPTLFNAAKLGIK